MNILSDREYRYSEIFYSPQGEGLWTGAPTAWLRLFSCNLECNGFGQKYPTKPETYELPYKEFDAKSVTKLADLPVWEKGCDSSYSWSKNYRHLAHKETGASIALKLIDSIKSKFNPNGLFNHPYSGNPIHLAFTGGEPMMQQDAIIDILEYLLAADNCPFYVTIETNGTQSLSKRFYNFFKNIGIHLTFSVSPKLFTVSGEPQSKALKPEVVKSYFDLADETYLKFVMSADEDAWKELTSVIELWKESYYIMTPVWVMPVGATDSGQAESSEYVAKKALEYGFNVSGRVHIALFGNKIGT